MNEKSSCTFFEPLVSAMLDNELELHEREQLELHLERCSHCKELLRAFGQVDSAVEIPLSERLGSVSRISITPKPPIKTLPVKRQSGNRWPSVWKLISLAAAATLLVSLAITAIPGPRTATAEQISADQFVQPMKDLRRINLQRQQDQDLMLRTLGMDLRSLKIELNQLEPGSDERKNLAAQVDTMIEKVSRFEIASNLD